MNTSYQLPHLGGHLMSTQVSTLLIRELKSGIFAQSERLPSEIELAERLKVSRTVIRDALSDLEREGMVERVRGIGTVINRDIVNLGCRLDLKLEYNDLIHQAGYRPSTDSIQLYRAQADAELAEKLELDLGAPIIVCEKRVLADSTPVIYSFDYLALSLFDRIDYTDLNWSLPIFDLLDRHCGLSVLSSIVHVQAVIGPPAIRALLGVREDQALMMLDEVGYGKLSRPILRSFEYFTDFFDFTMLRKKF